MTKVSPILLNPVDGAEHHCILAFMISLCNGRECLIAVVGSIKGIYNRFEYHKLYQTSLDGPLRGEPCHGAALSVLP